MGSGRIEEYCKRNFLKICDKINFKSCPCKSIDFENDISFCNFIKAYGKLEISENFKEKALLLKNVCPEVRNEILQHSYRVRQLQKQEKEFLEKVRPGDVVFCTAAIHDVVFLEHPSNIYGDVKYKTIDGEIREAPSFCFRIISKGNKFAEYETSDKEKADSYSRLARRNGFRVEKQKIKNVYVLKIYGDIQKEVDDFVTNLRIEFILNDFYDFFP